MKFISSVAGSRATSFYLADNVGIIQNASGSIQTAERTFGGCYSTASDVEDWLILDFQSHKLGTGPRLLYFTDIYTYVSCNENWVAAGPPENGAISVGTKSEIYSMTEAFTFASLTASNIPDLEDIQPYIGNDHGAFNTQSSVQSWPYATTYAQKITEFRAPYAIDLGQATKAIKGILIKLKPQRTSHADYSGQTIDSTIYHEIESDNIFLVSV